MRSDSASDIISPTNFKMRLVKIVSVEYHICNEKHHERDVTAMSKRKLDPNQLETEVKKSIDIMIQNNRMFTAFDITKMIRQNAWVDHRDVRDCVHGMFNRGEFSGTGYAKTLIPIPGKTPAFCYHIHNQDPNDYDSSEAFDDTTPCAKSIPTAVKVVRNGNCIRDKVRRINVPNGLVSSIGLQPGDVASVYVVADHFEITKDVRTTDPEMKYVVNCCGNIRFSGSVLDTCSLRDEFSADLSSTGDFIILKEA